MFQVSNLTKQQFQPRLVLATAITHLLLLDGNQTVNFDN